MCRPWNRVGFGRLTSGYSIVTRRPNNAWRSVTANPPHLLTAHLLHFRGHPDPRAVGEDLDARPAAPQPVRHRRQQQPVDGEGAQWSGDVHPPWPVLVLGDPVGG